MYKWQSTEMKPYANNQVPETSGVYALVENDRINGLPVGNRVLYIGKSKNLKRRFSDYANPRKVHNEMVGEKILFGDIEFWCTEVGKNDLDLTERQFINQFNAPFNKIKYKEHSNEQSKR